MRTIWYMGVKTRLTDAISAAVAEAAPRGEGVLDLMSGSAAVSTSLAGRYKVWANDVQAYAQAIAGALSDGKFTKRKGISPSAPVFELQGTFPVGGQHLAAHIKVTSTVGHMWSLDFPKEFNDGNKVTPFPMPVPTDR